VMIRATLSMIRELAQTCGISMRRLCPAVGISRSNVVRWRRRAHGTTLLQRPGPRKLQAADIAAVTSEIKELAHGRYRSRGTSQLYRKYSESYSRRDMEELIEAARAEANRDRRSQQRRITWNRSGVAWSMDDTEYRRLNGQGGTVMLHNLQDLGSKYKFGPLCGSLAIGEEVAGNLHRRFSQHGAPLFLKRDWGGNLNHSAVNEVCADFAVLPLNSPVCYPPYNGAVEEAQGELKKGLNNQIAGIRWQPAEDLEPYAGVAVHEINHQPRPCLGGKTACEVFFHSRATFTKPERKAIYEWLVDRQNSIINGVSNVSREAAWRIAVEQWLVKTEFITISINKQVLPDFQAGWNQN